MPRFSKLLVDYIPDTLYLSNRNYIQYTPTETLRTLSRLLGKYLTVHTTGLITFYFTPSKSLASSRCQSSGWIDQPGVLNINCAGHASRLCFFGGSIAKAGPGGRKSFQGGAKRRGSSYLLSTYSCFGILFPFGMIYDRRIHIQDEYS